MATFTVTTQAMRPRSMDDTCFYCRSRVGNNHKSNCVLIQRPVKIALELKLSVPANYSEEDIDYYFGEGNGRQQIAKFFDNDDWEADNLYLITNSMGEPFLEEK